MKKLILPFPYRGSRWIIGDENFAGGKMAIRDTDVPVSLVLSLLADGMTRDQIKERCGEKVEKAIPELLRVAASLADKAFAERWYKDVTQLSIPGLGAFVDWFGTFPLFHDSTVESMSLNLFGESHIQVLTWRGEADAEGKAIKTKNARVTFVIGGIVDISMSGLSVEMVLNEITFRRDHDAFKLFVQGHFGGDSEFTVKKLEVEFEPEAP